MYRVCKYGYFPPLPPPHTLAQPFYVARHRRALIMIDRPLSAVSVGCLATGLLSLLNTYRVSTVDRSVAANVTSGLQRRRG